MFESEKHILIPISRQFNDVEGGFNIKAVGRGAERCLRCRPGLALAASITPPLSRLSAINQERIRGKTDAGRE
ncbi:MAG: hypothetical protein ACFFBS_04605 [Promethearchaeota archaeon]